MIENLQSYFLNPRNLVALASVILLIVLYLLKPKPEKKVMPSVMFFQEDENPGKLKQGLRKIFRNKFLFLHILIFSLLAVSLADPYINQETTTEESTIYLDATANTAEEFAQVKQYATGQLSERNNLVIVSHQTEVYTDLSESQARQTISDTDSTDIYPDTETRLSSVNSLEGDLFIASNLADLTSSEAQNLIDEYDSDRSVDVYTDEFENSWGITDYSITEENVELYIKNYRSQSSEIELNMNSERLQSFEIAANELRTAEVELSEGENNVSLSNDEFSGDNTIYVQNPASDNIQVNVAGDHPYMREVVKSIPEAELSDQDTDILVTGQTSSNIFSRVENGLNLVYMSDEGSSGSELPVRNLEPSEGDVAVERPVSKQLYNAEYLEGNVDSEAESLANPESAIVKMDRGEGTIIQYNIIDNSFSRSIMFPLFWKPLFQNMTETVGMQEANKLTGQQINGNILTSKGYSDVNSNQYAVSTTGSFPPKMLDAESGNSFSTKPKSLSTQLNIAIVLLLLLESVLLFRERVI
jgi:hypothetical protein